MTLWERLQNHAEPKTADEEQLALVLGVIQKKDERLLEIKKEVDKLECQRTNALAIYHSLLKRRKVCCVTI